MATLTPREQELETQLAAVTSERDQALNARDQALLEVKLLREKLDALARRLFGKKSEQLNETQLLLLLQEMEAPGPALGKGSSPEALEALPPPRLAKEAKRRERTPRMPENLPVLEEVLVPEAVQASPEAWRKIGEEVSEQIDFEPARFLCRRLVRPKYVRRGDADAVPTAAPLPPVLQERCLAAPGLIAQVLVAKFCDHLPLYRQEAIYWSRHHVWLPRQSLARWVGLAADWLKPIYEEIRSGVLGGSYVQIDETPIKYLDPGHGQARQGYLWTANKPGGDVAYHWQTSRAAACLEKIVPVDFRGVIQSDGYQAYPSFAKGRDGRITLAACWAHVRRGFFEAKEHAPQQAGFILRQIQHLYAVEARLRKERAGPRLRAAMRAAQSRPIIRRLHRLLTRLKTGRKILPQSAFGKAIDYALGQWPGLLTYLEEGQVEIDNNGCENAIRPTAIGKKNWLFFGEAQSGERGAILYTLIESCRRRGIDPYAYLRDVLTRLPRMTNWQIKDITPEAWAKAQHQRSSAKAA